MTYSVKFRLFFLLKEEKNHGCKTMSPFKRKIRKYKLFRQLLFVKSYLNFRAPKVVDAKYLVQYTLCLCKVEKILKDCLDSVPSLSPTVKIQTMGRKVCLRCKCKTFLGINKLLKTKSLLTSPSNALPHYLK